MESLEKNYENRLLCGQSEPVMIKGVILRTGMRPAIKWRLPTELIRAALKVDRF